MQIDLDPALKARIDRLVAEGGYDDATQLLTDALDMLNPVDAAEIEELRASIEESDREGVWFTPDEVRAHLNEQFAELDKNSAVEATARRPPALKLISPG